MENKTLPNTNPVKKNGYSSKIRKTKLQARRDDAAVRKLAWNKLSPQQKIDSLKLRGGNNKKQVAKLSKLI